MAETINGARLWNTPSEGSTQNSALFLGANSTAYTKGDIVAHQGGLLVIKNVISSPFIVGVAVRTQTMDSDNQTVAKVYPKYIDVAQKELSFLMGTNADLTATTSVGLYMSVNSDGTTNTQQVDINEPTVLNREILCLEVDPQAEGGSGSGSGVRQGVFRFVKVLGKQIYSS